MDVMTEISAFAKKLLGEEEAAALIEYALLGTLIAVVSVVALTAAGVSVRELFQQVAVAVTNAVQDN